MYNSSHPALYWIWNSLPSALSSLASTVSQVAGGVGGGYGHGHRHHLSRHGNKHNNLPAYDDYDYNYSAAAEHYVSYVLKNMLKYIFSFIEHQY